jgi:predicted ATPase
MLIHNYADTGFGVSQVLPLIVQGLYGDEDTMLIAEQPEIHLNPKLQALLADLFCDFASRKVNVLVETHSEHLLLRLRRLIAEGSIKSNQVALYYVERDKDKSLIREIPIKDNGHVEIKEWPRGFFQDSLRESIGLASAQSKKGKNA